MMGNMNNSMNGSMNRMGGTSKDALLMAGFAVTEANLYLDTHPCDSQAIAYLKQMSQAYADARNAYEAQYGPLRAENARDTVYWSWTDDPWPWEGGGY